MTRFDYHRRRAADFAGALRMGRELSERERWQPERLREHQRRRLEAVVRHAASRSRFYGERLGGLVGDGPVELERLPVLEKAEMMERFDDLVVDPRLRRDELLGWVEQVGRDELYDGRYRVMTTSGSSGRKGLFVYDGEAWRAILAQFLRYSAMVGIRPRLPRRLRIAAVGAAAPMHMSRQIAASISLGVHRVLALPVTLPLDRMVDELNRFRPDVVNAYPSAAVRLADEQLAGRLGLSLSAMSTSSEMRTPEMTERLVEAFGVHPFDTYATTEGLWGCECDRHAGIHLFEDLTLVENVDAGGRPVPPGEPGARLLVTCLHNFVQPIIRLAVSDVVTLDPEPCACGRTLVRARAVQGRSEDVIELPGRGGEVVAVTPYHFGLVSRDRDVREFQVVQEGTAVRIAVVAGERVGGDLELRLRDAVSHRLAELGVEAPQVTVERRDDLPRSAGGKLQIVVADRERAAVSV